MLRDFPDRRLVSWLVAGLQSGFRLGCCFSALQLKPERRNIPSAYEHPEVVDAYLMAEVQKGRILSPIPQPPMVPLQVSRFGVIPKKYQPGKWRLIVDLSFPEGRSVNEGYHNLTWTLPSAKYYT